jgi:hypothetical protein
MKIAPLNVINSFSQLGAIVKMPFSPLIGYDKNK